MVNGVSGADTWAWADGADARTCAADPRATAAAVPSLRLAPLFVALSLLPLQVVSAKLRLAKEFAFVGDVGHFGQSVWLLQRVFGWAKEHPSVSAL